MSFLSVTFAGFPVSAYQDSEINYQITANEVQLYNGEIFGTLSPITQNFPRSFDCYTEDYTEISNLAGKIGTFGELVIGGESFSNCYISSLGSIKEVWRGSGHYTYTIKFSKVDQH
mgnify:CR=1 FL=1